MGQLMPMATTILVLLVTSASGYETGSGAILFPQWELPMQEAAANAGNLTSLTGIAGQLDRQYGSLTLSLVLLYIRAEEGTGAAIEDKDEDVTTETVSKCGAEF